MMTVKPRENFKPLITILDKINPFLIIISIVGLFMEYTVLKPYVLTPNKIISVIFVLDFLLRIISFNPGKYFVYGYGWVDFLASLPGFFFFLNNTPLFTIFKIIKVGRFFKIIRILRFLRVFNFLKRMKSDSVWIQDRIMKIGVTIVMIYIAGIVLIDNYVTDMLIEREAKLITIQYKANNNDFLPLINDDSSIVFYFNDSVLYDRNNNIVNDYSVLEEMFSSEIESFISIAFTDKTFAINGFILPAEGIVKDFKELSVYQNKIMILLLTTLLVILTVMIFYMGFVFAKDIQIVQLIIDSFDAGDDLLLKQEAEAYREEDGSIIINPDDSELINLLKASIIEVENNSNNSSDDMLMGLGNLIGQEESTVTNENIDIESILEEKTSFLVEDTIKRLTPAIVKYIKKELKH